MNGQPNTKIVSVPMGAGVRRPGGEAYLTHAAEIDGNGRIVRALCPVSLAHLVHDSSQYDVHVVDCKTCARRKAKLEQRS